MTTALPNKYYSGHKVADKQSDKNTWKVDMEKETNVDSSSRYSWRKMEKVAQNTAGRKQVYTLLKATRNNSSKKIIVDKSPEN